jgi:hypothetical protein
MASTGSSKGSKGSDETSSIISMVPTGQGRGVSSSFLRRQHEEEGEAGSSRGFLEDEQSIYITKPDNVNTKLGSSGTEVRLKANFFEIEEFKDFEFNQYRVDFAPDLDMSNIRKAFIGKNISPFGGKKYFKKAKMSLKMLIK